MGPLSLVQSNTTPNNVVAGIVIIILFGVVHRKTSLRAESQLFDGISDGDTSRKNSKHRGV